MRVVPSPPDPRQAWIDQIFSAKSVARGGVVRRSVRWVETQIGRDRIIEEVRARGFHMVECGGQFVIICNPGGLRVVC